jgi:Protein similar to CwfJ C-terminus 1
VTAEQCVFCLGNGHLRTEQILWRGDDLYLCAPRGQLVEGCLIIAPYRCVGCLARAVATQIAELEHMRGVVEAFYADVYGVTRATFYEQGRAGGGAVTDHEGGFPHHGHLFCLPLAVDLHRELAQDYARLEGVALTDVRSPYVYVDGMDAAVGDRRRAMYVPRSREGWAALERLRLKPTVARLVGLPQRGDWRVHPGDRELEKVIEKFTSYRAMNGVRHE